MDRDIFSRLPFTSQLSIVTNRGLGTVRGSLLVDVMFLQLQCGMKKDGYPSPISSPLNTVPVKQLSVA